MKPNYKTLAASLSLLALSTLCGALANAQLSTSLSQSLDSNLSGLNSTVAPIPSTEIEPGANNLQTPDEHVLPYDAIGASLVATPMNPDLFQYNPLSRVPFQVDNSLRDASLLTGLHVIVPVNVVEVIASGQGKTVASSFAQSASTSRSTSSMIPLGSQAQNAPGVNRVLPSTINPQSSWMVGRSAAAMTIIPSPTAEPPTNEPPGQPLTSDKNGGDLLRKKQKVEDNANDSTQQPTEQTQDYSKSPLESSADITTGPFDSLDKKSFLSPDITKPRSRSNAPTKRTETSLTTRMQANHSEPGMNGTKDREMSRAESRLMKDSSTQAQTKRSHWHNPILQQMENDSSPNRQ